jgi:hypothetical protein
MRRMDQSSQRAELHPPVPEQRKNKRGFSEAQTTVMNAHFATKNALGGSFSSAEIAAIAAEVGLTDTQVRVYFQNRRARTRDKQARPGASAQVPAKARGTRRASSVDPEARLPAAAAAAADEAPAKRSRSRTRSSAGLLGEALTGGTPAPLTATISSPAVANVALVPAPHHFATANFASLSLSTSSPPEASTVASYAMPLAPARPDESAYGAAPPPPMAMPVPMTVSTPPVAQAEEPGAMQAPAEHKDEA